MSDVTCWMLCAVETQAYSKKNVMSVFALLNPSCMLGALGAIKGSPLSFDSIHSHWLAFSYLLKVYPVYVWPLNFCFLMGLSFGWPKMILQRHSSRKKKLFHFFWLNLPTCFQKTISLWEPNQNIPYFAMIAERFCQ